MKYESNNKWFVLIITIVLAIVANFENSLNLPGPAHQTFMLVFLLVYIVLLIFVGTYERFKLKRFFWREEEENETLEGRRLFLDNSIQLITYILFLVYIILDYFKYLLDPMDPARPIFKNIYLAMLGFYFLINVYEMILKKQLYKNEKDKDALEEGKSFLFSNIITLISVAFLFWFIVSDNDFFKYNIFK